MSDQRSSKSCEQKKKSFELLCWKKAKCTVMIKGDHMAVKRTMINETQLFWHEHKVNSHKIQVWKWETAAKTNGSPHKKEGTKDEEKITWESRGNSGKITDQHRTADQKNGRGGQRTRHQVTQKRFEEKIVVPDLSSFNHLIVLDKESEQENKRI